MIKWKHSTRENFWQALEALPPAIMRGGGFLLGEPHDLATCTVTGKLAENFSAYFEIGEQYFEACRALTVAEFKTVTAADILANLETEGAAHV